MGGPVEPLSGPVLQRLSFGSLCESQEDTSSGINVELSLCSCDKI